MGETWFQREFLAPRRLAFNVFFYGSQIFWFALGWYLQVCLNIISLRPVLLTPLFHQETDKKLVALNGLTYSVWTSRGAGLVLAYTGGLILLPMLRNIIRIIRPKLTWLFPADENIWFHRQVAYSMAFWAMVHTTAHYVNFINVERTRTFCVSLTLAPLTLFIEVRPQLALQIHYTQPGGITGHFMLLMMVLIYSTAHHKIRAQCFEAFWYTHHLAFFFMIALYTHATGCFVRDSANPDYIPTFPFYSTEHCLGYESWRFIIWPGIIYFGERVYREIRARRATRLSKLLVHPSGLSDTLSHILSKSQLLQVPWNFALSSPASSTPQASGCSSRFPMSPVSNGIQSVSQFLHDDARTQMALVHHHVCSRRPIRFDPHPSSW